MAPVVRALRAAPERFESLVCVSAQHRSMLDQVLEVFDLAADIDLDLMVPGQSPAGIAAGILDRLPPLLRRVRPHVVLVQGDTTTTFAASFAAFLERVPTGHVEAGLRTGDRWQPFPEEMNRVLTTRIAALHFAPTPAARDALAGGGHTGRRRAPDRQHGDRRAAADGAAGVPVPHAGARGARSGPPAGPGDHPPPGELRRPAPVHLRGDPGAGGAVSRAAVRAAGAPEPRGQAHRRGAALRSARDAPDPAGRLPRVRAPDGPRRPGAHRQRWRAGGGPLARETGAGAPGGHRAAGGRHGRHGARGGHRPGADRGGRDRAADLARGLRADGERGQPLRRRPRERAHPRRRWRNGSDEAAGNRGDGLHRVPPGGRGAAAWGGGRGARAERPARRSAPTPSSWPGRAWRSCRGASPTPSSASGRCVGSPMSSTSPSRCARAGRATSSSSG